MKAISRKVGLVEYGICWETMRVLNRRMTAKDFDEFWTVEHPPVYTLGKRTGLGSVSLRQPEIPVVKSDRGGQVTYHGPGQLIVYTILNIRRLGFGPKEFVMLLEKGVIDYLNALNITACGRRESPGVYVQNRKIASLGLRIANGYSYHGLALNVDMDLEPFRSINPCGMENMEMTQLAEFGIKSDLDTVSYDLRQKLYKRLYPTQSVSEIRVFGFPERN